MEKEAETGPMYKSDGEWNRWYNKRKAELQSKPEAVGVTRWMERITNKRDL